MEIGDQDCRANAKTLLSQHTRFLLEEKEAKATISGTIEKVRTTWYDVARAWLVASVDEARRCDVPLPSQLNWASAHLTVNVIKNGSPRRRYDRRSFSFLFAGD